MFLLTCCIQATPASGVPNVPADLSCIQATPASGVPHGFSHFSDISIPPDLFDMNVTASVVN